MLRRTVLSGIVVAATVLSACRARPLGSVVSHITEKMHPLGCARSPTHSANAEGEVSTCTWLAGDTAVEVVQRQDTVRAVGISWRSASGPTVAEAEDGVQRFFGVDVELRRACLKAGVEAIGGATGGELITVLWDQRSGRTNYILARDSFPPRIQCH